MAFQTSILRDGEWVTQTVNLHAVLKSQKGASSSKAPTRQDPLKLPRCGLLTQTVVESVVVNSILPVRLRSPHHNDIAFVQDYAVRICELRKDGRLQEVARKTDFGCRIRNACVVGSFVIPDLKDEDDDMMGSAPSISAVDTTPDDAAANPPAAPQRLMLVLEDGQSVYLFLRTGPGGKPEFVGSRLECPRQLDGYFGFHLAIDPSSRYVAMAGPVDYFVVSRIDLDQQPVEKIFRDERMHSGSNYFFRSVRGVVQKISFLHPRPGDDHHIILLLIVVRRGKSRMVIYEWEAGDDLAVALSEERSGHRMPAEHQMPLLLIPLMVQSAFVVISEDHMAVCSECLHGPPKFEALGIIVPPPSVNHRGAQPPLWTAWARPFRLQTYSKSRDCVYLAREDGVVLFMATDEDGSLANTTVIDTFPCTISRAFACLFDHSTDVLVLGSDSGSGGYWKIPPRQHTELLGIIPNWSPVVDFTTTDEFTGWRRDDHKDKDMVRWQDTKLRKPDRVFATCEGGAKGAITEYRYGLKADIGLDLEYGLGVKQAWLLPARDPSPSDGYLLLLSMPDSSAALILSSDFTSAAPLTPDATPYDLTAATLALETSEDLTVQVTMQNIVLVAGGRSNRLSYQSSPQLANAYASDACIRDGYIVLSTHTDTQFQAQVFSFDPATLVITHVRSIDVDGEITCLAINPIHTLLAGVRKNSQVFLANVSLQQPATHVGMFNLTEGNGGDVGLDMVSAVEGIASIVPVREGAILLGTRGGELITIQHYAGRIHRRSEKLGGTAVHLNPSHKECTAAATVLVTCDDKLVAIRPDKRDGLFRIDTKFRVWPVDASNLQAAAPPVHYATAVDLPSEDGTTPILMLSGARLLLAELHHRPSPVQRVLPVDGTPNRVIYCHSTQCLVAAVNQDSGPTLKFINPDTGEDIGRPTDKNGEPQPYIAGLGKAGDRILGLAEWNYRRDGNVWNFILVTTRSGRLILVSTQKVVGGPVREGGAGSGAGGGQQQQPGTIIRYWTRFRKEVKEPMYSVFGYDGGLVYCFGRTVQWEVLDVQERKLKPLRSVTLGSPAVHLGVSHGKLLALTSAESIVVLDHHHPPQDNGTGAPAEAEPRICHVDTWRRNAIDFIEIAAPGAFDNDITTTSTTTTPTTADNNNDDDNDSNNDPSDSILLVSDREGGVTGLWVPWRFPDRDCEVLFEAELPAAIRRFHRGRTRPAWEQQQHLSHQPQQQQQQQQQKQQQEQRLRYGRLPATQDDADILGVTLAGALQRFVLLRPDAWRLLKFVESLVRACSSSSGGGVRTSARAQMMAVRNGNGNGGGTGGGPGPEPRVGRDGEMHVDGDVLVRVLEGRRGEEGGEGKGLLEEAVMELGVMERLREVVGGLEGGRYTGGLREQEGVGGEEGDGDGDGDGAYFRLVYDVLEYYLAPVL